MQICITASIQRWSRGATVQDAQQTFLEHPLQLQQIPQSSVLEAAPPPKCLFPLSISSHPHFSLDLSCVLLTSCFLLGEAPEPLNCKSMVFQLLSILLPTHDHREESTVQRGKPRIALERGEGKWWWEKTPSVSDPFCHCHNRTLLKLIVRIR